VRAGPQPGQVGAFVGQVIACPARVAARLVAAVLFFLGLVAAWITVAVRTAHGVFTGHLLR
ncbi:hypothetical protein SAMN05661080_04983, partial [Modestobacter sp. DSM 44400]